MEKPPWSNSQLRLLGSKIREGSSGYDNDPSYDAVMSYFNGLAISAQTRLDYLDWEPLLGMRTPEVTSRPKTIDTLRQKLQRDPATPLQSVQDIAGVRFEAEMSLDEQDSVAEAVAGMFNERREDAIRDMRESPHSGYRAVHVWLRLPARVEIQIRTHLQGMWANMYESAADTLGRKIRYGELPKDSTSRQTVTALHKLSAQIAEIENKRNLLDRRERELAEVSEALVVARHAPDDSMLKIEDERQYVMQQEQSVLDVCGTLRTAFESMPRREGNN